MRVLFTGSSGWLGRFLAPRLRAAGHTVTGLDLAPGSDTQIVADRSTIDRAFSRGGSGAGSSPLNMGSQAWVRPARA